MEAKISTSFMALMTGMLLFTGCLKDQCDRTHEFIRYDPVYKTLDGMRVDISVHGPQELKSPGNIYYYNGYLLINERLKGVHVIDNHDPANPVNVAFIEIPGNRDIAIRNNILYADMFIDLVAIDITDIENPVLECRVENVFEQFYSFAGDFGYIVEYVPSNEVVHVDCSDDRWNTWWWRGGDDILWLSAEMSIDVAMMDASSFQGKSSAGSSSTGIAGSMARFTLAKDHLYTLDLANMHVFNLSSNCPEKKSSVEMRWGIETLFPYGDYLFVGSNNGMLIYDNENPESPSFLSEFSHAQACDPVFVSDDIAYVTLRDGSDCRNFVNQLDVIDVSTITSPSLIKSYPMQHPHGLSVVDNTLFLCEGEFGLKIFDVENSGTIADRLLSRIEGLYAFDVIVLPQENVAMVIGQEGLYQYDVSDRSKPGELSMIPISK
ncbi:MAG TPA: hypothetical protein VI603_05915 [Saprospiraceae bacterium]|nr:hypothetical protein [Saprospiraceae bacterium]